MINFRSYNPTKIIFGKDTYKEIGGILGEYGKKKVLMVYGGRSLKANGVYDQVVHSLEASGILFFELGGVKSNPRLSLVYEGIEIAKREQIDMVLAVGGGSVIDTAKAVAHGVANPEVDIWEFWCKNQVSKKALPIGVVLTLSAAGSETSDSAVLTNEEIGVKRGLSTDLNRPAFALMNPELTYTLPVYQVGCGIVDIMMHTLDRYFTQTEHNEMTDVIAEGLLRTVIKNGAVAILNSHDYDAMSELMWAGSLSHNGLTGLGAVTDFAVHQLGHELSARFDIAHGASLSAVWGAWATYVCPAKPERFAQFAKNVWGIEDDDVEAAGKKAIEKTVTYFHSLHMPTCFSEAKEIGLKTDDEVKALAKGCSYGATRTIGSFKVCDVNDMYEIYKLANH